MAHVITVDGVEHWYLPLGIPNGDYYHACLPDDLKAEVKTLYASLKADGNAKPDEWYNINRWYYAEYVGDPDRA